MCRFVHQLENLFSEVFVSFTAGGSLLDKYRVREKRRTILFLLLLLLLLLIFFLFFLLFLLLLLLLLTVP